MEMNKVELKKFRSEFEKAVAKLEKSYGVEIGLGNISFDEKKFTTKLTVTNKQTSAQKKSDKKTEFVKYANLVGLKPSHFGKTFKQGSKVYTVSGINMKKRKNVVELTCNGSIYMGSAETVLRQLK